MEAHLSTADDVEFISCTSVFLTDTSNFFLDLEGSFQVIGLVDPLGPTTTTCEMQARMVAHMWAHQISCPIVADMLKDIKGT